jgi:hypothetical protein
MGIAVGDGIHEPLMQLIRRLDVIGMALIMAVRRYRQRGAPQEAAPARHAVDRACDLLGETIRWQRVLYSRFCANILAEKAALMQAAAAESGAIEPPENESADAASKEPVHASRRGPREPDLDRAIRRKSIAEIMERICADLGTAATLLGETDAAREVAAIAEALRALLDDAGGGVEAVVAQPVSGSGVKAAIGAGPAMLSAAAAPVRAPDSG